MFIQHCLFKIIISVEITYPFLNFNGATDEVQEWISNPIPYFTGRVITYPCWDLNHVSKGGHWDP